MKQKDLAVGLAIGMACGMVVGAVAGVLLAPASGAETRRRLRFEGDNAVDLTRNQVRRAMAKLHLAQSEAGSEEDDEATLYGV